MAESSDNSNAVSFALYLVYPIKILIIHNTFDLQVQI